MQDRRRRAGEVNLSDLLLLALLLVSMIAGLAWGIELGSVYGFAGKLIGGVLGGIVGVVSAVLICLAIAVVSEPFDYVWRWWRPYPPLCDNGTCVGLHSYRPCEIPDDIAHRVRGLARFGYRCQCGNVYAGGCDYPLLNRWVRIMPDGEVRPYLRHRWLGRWIPDETTVVLKATESAASGPPLDVPGWVIPVAMTAICGGIALWIVYVSPDAKSHPIDPWFVLGCAVLGLAIGCVVWWREARRNGDGPRTN